MACKCFFETREASVCSESSAKLLKLLLDRGYALTKHPVKETTAAVSIVDESKNTLCINKSEHFSSFHNFEYGDIGLRVWKCYGIGKGKYIPYDVIYIKHPRSNVPSNHRISRKFNVVLLRAICSHFEIPVKLRDKKQILIDKLSDVISDCQCVSQ
ncbi:hypothetical protein pdam_00019979 [Pocillopora damicornis]|uniref:Uncharacterized protein n=1 Tax=Pocillopora damicornis TaxID=46731 RepID=A0A3M6TW93_POCDA|nr:hypothetical protein pdam_00019979 [Pocillopora damicornis]